MGCLQRWTQDFVNKCPLCQQLITRIHVLQSGAVMQVMDVAPRLPPQSAPPSQNASDFMSDGEEQGNEDDGDAADADHEGPDDAQPRRRVRPRRTGPRAPRWPERARARREWSANLAGQARRAAG